MRAFDGLADVGLCLFSRFTAFVRLASCTQAGTAELDGLVGRAAAQRLSIGIGANEFHTSHRCRDHVLHRIATATAYANDFDLCALVKGFFFDHFDAHVVTP